MGPRGKPFGVGISQDHQEDHGRQGQASPVELPRRPHKEDRTHPDKQDGGSATDLAGGQGPVRGAGIGGVEPGIRQAVESHGGAPGPHHGHQDEEQGPRLRQTPGRQQGPHEGERQGQDAVADLDHLQQFNQIMKKSPHRCGSRFSFYVSRLLENSSVGRASVQWGGRPRPPTDRAARDGRPQHYPFFIFCCVRKEMIVQYGPN